MMQHKKEQTSINYFYLNIYLVKLKVIIVRISSDYIIMIKNSIYYLFKTFCSMKVLPEYKGIKLVFRGNLRHYNFIR